MDIIKKRLAVVCQCDTIDHIMIAQSTKYEENDNDFSIHINLNHYLSFWKRIIVGVKYIFGYKSKNDYNFNNIIVNNDDLKKLKELIEYHNE